MEELSFERAAMKGEELPAGLKLTEQKAFYCLRLLYSDYHAEKITREQAAAEKQKIIFQMQEEIKTDEMNIRISQLWKRIETAAGQYADNPSIEAAERFYAAVYGLPNDWRAKRDC